MTQKQKILIVDDKPENLFALEKVLRNLDIEIIQAKSGNDALVATLNHKFDLAILDVQMPGMDGYELAEFMRQEDVSKNIPIIFLSAIFSDYFHIFKGYQSGAIDFITKPYHPEILLSKVKINLQLQDNNRLLEKQVQQRTEDLERSRQEIAHREQQLRTLINTMPDLVWLKDQQGVYLACNSKCERYFGATENEIIGKTDYDFVDKELADFFRKNDQRAIEADRPCIIEEEITYSDDGHIELLETIRTSMHDSQGHLVGVLGIGRDLTKRKQLEAQLQRAQKIKAIGQLAAGIAHEINTPIQFISDNTQFLKTSFNYLQPSLQLIDRLAATKNGIDERLIDEIRCLCDKNDLEYVCDEIPQALEDSIEGIQRISRIVSAMKEFSHPGTGNKVSTDLNRAVESTVEVSRNVWKYVAEMITHFDEEMPMVFCFPDLLNQAVLNLITNAAHAIEETGGENLPPRGSITIATRHDEKWAEIKVSDTGIGIPEEMRERIFDLFFTTKEIGRGTGQGMSIIHDVIVHKHGGTLDFTSATGQGTTFVIRLPITAAKDEADLATIQWSHS